MSFHDPIDLVDVEEENEFEEKEEKVESEVSSSSTPERTTRDDSCLRHYSFDQLKELRRRIRRHSYPVPLPGSASACMLLRTGRGDAGVGTFNGKGYIQISYWSKAKVMGHHIIYKVDVDPSWWPDVGYQLSHLCHNNGCIEPTHLTDEFGVYNLSRNYCPYAIEFDCPHPEVCGTADHRHTIIVCAHTPRCLRRGSLYGATAEQLQAAGNEVSHKKRRSG